MLGFCSCWLTVWLKTEILRISRIKRKRNKCQIQLRFMQIFTENNHVADQKSKTNFGYNLDLWESLPGEQHWFWMAATLADCSEIVHRLIVLLLVMDKGGTVRSRPIAPVTLVRVFPGVASSVVYQVVRAL